MDLLESAIVEGGLWQRVRLDAGEGQPLHRHPTWQRLVVIEGEIETGDGARLVPPLGWEIPAREPHEFTAVTASQVWMFWGAENPSTELVVP